MKNIFLKKSLLIILCLAIYLSVFCDFSITAFAQEAVTVPKIEVTTEQGNGLELEKADGYVNADIRITDTDGTELADAVQFKVRGNTTSLSWITKKPFAFKFSKKKNVLNMGKGKKWVLIANAFDPTLLRNYLAFETANKLGLAYTSNQKFVELWVDNSYRGCYTLYEPVQAGTDRVDIDTESNNGMNDFLLEYESFREEEDVTYFTVDSLRFISSEPENPTEEQLSYIQTTMTDIINTIRTGTQEQIESKIDITSFVKFYLMNEYFKTYDFNISSVYFYYKGGLLYAGPPWDYDLSMGNSNPTVSERCKNANSSQNIYADKNIYQYLTNKAWFKGLVTTEYEANLDYFSNIHQCGGMLDTLRATYSDVFNRNYTLTPWHEGSYWINIQRPADSSYEQNYNFLTNWLNERYLWFNSYFKPFEGEYDSGDANLDGKFNINDATYIQLYKAELIKIPNKALLAADQDIDGKINIRDVTTIQLQLAGLES